MVIKVSAKHLYMHFFYSLNIFDGQAGKRALVPLTTNTGKYNVINCILNPISSILFSSSLHVLLEICYSANFLRVRRSSARMRRCSVGIMRRLAVSLARVRVLARHPVVVHSAERRSDEDMMKDE